MKRLVLLLLVLTCLVLFSGCGDKDPRPEGHFAIQFENKTGIFITSVLAFGEGDYEWGKDLLKEDEVIEPGEIKTLYIPEGEFFLYPFSYEEYIMGSFRVNGEDTAIEVGKENAVPILIVNNSEYDLPVILLSPSDSDDWGESLLPSFSFIPAGYGRRFFFVEPDVYDFQAWSSEGDIVITETGIDISGMRTLIIPEQ